MMRRVECEWTVPPALPPTRAARPFAAAEHNGRRGRGRREAGNRRNMGSRRMSETIHRIMMVVTGVSLYDGDVRSNISNTYIYTPISSYMAIGTATHALNAQG